MSKNSDAAEVQFLRDWCLTVANLILEGTGRYDAYVRPIEMAGSRGDLKGLRVAAKDLTEWANGLQPAHRTRIDEQLRHKYGRGLSSEDT